MDTFASLILAGELPMTSTDVLTRTTPFKKGQDNLFTFDMKFTVFTSTLYQQAVLYYFFYNGSLYFYDKETISLFIFGGPKYWYETGFFKGFLQNGNVDFYSEPT